jgi:hypothetical protein
VDGEAAEQSRLSSLGFGLFYWLEEWPMDS